ncbi:MULTISPECIES: type III secretion system stator protein SctL [Rhizobium]|jgi:type III secretion protein L|uniref:Type 3 secretion system stator protein n=10 Tax=Rhizobium TaxID=379 RepID=A0A7W4MKT9_9HYPH|nr:MULTISPECIES: type III secretion system stator protein SctL [Rhizobium]EGE59764.1 nodulation protein [Rhizobium etli CNPAF512]ANK94112.1 type III secretion system HrpE/YscL family / Nodulation NolV protein [Rhizobium sp. N6212]ANL00162.1 type III secretion system HrpE/YscL family / Nodulation NolV protein [Rhizobium sp. N621]ANL06290.1 type III secretion system HrpE/YscL family / Nodulation NolV protein [Rhizobium esperanzae]ANL12457.1 type III secretion system HrpE/YscL family / Nodulation
MSSGFARHDRIIPAENFGQIREAAQILAAARQDAAQSQATLAAASEQAAQNGYRDGFEQGVRDAAARLAASLGKAEQEIANLDSWVEAVVLKSVGLILGSMEADERTRRLVRHAISQTAEAQEIALHVAPEDAAMIAQAIADIDHRITIETDPLMSAGEIVLETSAGRSQIGLKDQLATVIEALVHG